MKMNTLTKGMAVIGFIASLGIVMPSSFGGSVLADIPVNPDGPPNNPNGFKTTLNCDLSGDGQPDKVFDVVTTSSARMSQDTNSSTVFVVGYSDQHRDTPYLAPPADDPQAPVDPQPPFHADLLGTPQGH